jgi:hypothetical protein
MSLPMWTRYQVRWDFLSKLCSSVPADPLIVQEWLTARRPTVRPPGSRSIEEINEEVLSTLVAGQDLEEKECSILTFQREKGICVMRADTVRAHLKECARKVGTYHVGRIEKEKAFQTTFVDCVYMDPAVYWLPILRPDGAPVVTHDGTKDKAMQVMTAQGPRSALKQFEWIEPARLDFTLLVLNAAGMKPGKKEEAPKPLPSVTEKDLATVMSFGGIKGYAGERSAGEGKYTFTITREE